MKLCFASGVGLEAPSHSLLESGTVASDLAAAQDTTRFSSIVETT